MYIYFLWYYKINTNKENLTLLQIISYAPENMQQFFNNLLISYLINVYNFNKYALHNNWNLSFLFWNIVII